MAFDPSEWEVVGSGSSGGGGGFDPSEWEIVGADAPKTDFFGASTPAQQFGRTVVGGLSKLIPFNLGDEVVAGGSALATGLKKMLTGDDSPGFSLSNTYDNRLNEVRDYQKGFDQESPAAGVAVDLLGATALPVGGLVSKGTTLPAKLGLSAVEGGAIGAGYGFGAGEGTENRLKDAATTGLLTGAISPVMTGIGQGASKLFNTASDDFLKGALNVQRSDLQSAGKFAPKGSSKESPLMEALRFARDKGVISAGDDAVATIEKNENAIDEIGDQVTNLLKSADAAQKDVVIPAFKKAQSFISERPFEKDALQSQLQRRLADINIEWDGSISGLNRLKQKLYKISYKSGTESADLDKALASDLREFIEAQAETLLGKEASQTIGALNRDQGKLLTARKLFEKNKYQEEMPGGAAKALRRAIVSPIGGLAAGAGLSYATGDNRPLAIGMAGGLLSTRQGQLALSKLLGGLAETTPAALGKIPTGGADLFSSSGSQRIAPELRNIPQPNQAEGQMPQQLPKEGAPRTSPEISSLFSSFNSSPKSPENSINMDSVFDKIKTPSNVSETLSKAIQAVESNGRKDAVSKSKDGSPIAHGTHQVTPIAMREVMRKNGIDDSEYTNEDLRKLAMEDGVSKKVGEAYLSILLDKYPKDPLLAYAAYNAGPTQVDKLLKRVGGDSYDDIADIVPAETQKYVPRVENVFNKLLKA